MTSESAAELKSDALHYHREPRPGKLEIAAIKPLGNQRDLALAYSPGVAFACEAIVADPEEAANLTARQNLVAVLTNGTAVLGLGAIGPLAGKPVMEGKAVLFKKFSGIDVFDIEVKETDIDKLVDIIVALEPTFGGINLEDIKGPECFEVEEKAKARMGIPVFHDDQHGTAIIVSAAVTNALELTGKRFDAVKVVCSGAGAAALASLNLLASLGVKRENIFVCDIEGVVYKGREKLMDRWKAVYAQDTKARTLAEVIEGADIFVGLSAGGVLKPEHVKRMARDPLIMALANPTPEIMPELAQEARPDAMICTGRSDYPNQVNNVLCFPYIFRGALDVVASDINEAMKHAAVKAIAALARETPSEVVARAYGGEAAPFGRASLIPSPFDPRLMLRIAPAVARAAMESGVARRPIADFDAYADRLSRFVFRSGLMMKPLFATARAARKRVIYSEGEDERVLRATQVVLEDGLAEPILIGRPEVIRERIKRYGLRMNADKDFAHRRSRARSALPRVRCHLSQGRRAQGRDARRRAHHGAHQHHGDRRAGAAARRSGRADLRPRRALRGAPQAHQGHHRPRAGREGLRGAVAGDRAERLVLSRRHARALRPHRRGDRRSGVRLRPSRAPLRHHAEDRADLAFRLRLRRHALGATRCARALALVNERTPDFEIDGEMQADTALSLVARARVTADCRLSGEANVLIFPNLDAGSHRAATDPRDRRRAAGRPDPRRSRQARARADSVGHRARHRQHDRDRGGRGGGSGIDVKERNGKIDLTGPRTRRNLAMLPQVAQATRRQTKSRLRTRGSAERTG